MADGIRPGLLSGLEVPGREAGSGSRTGPDRGAGPEWPPSFSVRGGPGTIYAELADLDRGSTVLAAVGVEALALSRRAAGWGLAMNVAVAHTGLAGRLQQHTATLATGLLGVGGEAEVLAQGVGLAAQAYRAAEERARTGFRELMALTGHGGLADVSATVATGWHLVHDRPVPVALAERGVQGLPTLVTGVLDLASLGMIARGITVASTTAAAQARDEGVRGAYSAPELIYPLLTWTGRALGMVQIGPVRPREPVPSAETWRAVGPSRSTGAVTRLAEDLDRAAATAGAIQVTRITPVDPDAPETVWVVTLPGTQEDGLVDEDGWATNAFDSSGNAEGLALDSQHVSMAVRQVLEDAGAARGDALVFSGYSQGGIHAARLAADERLTGDYPVAGVLTIGSPVGEIALPEDAAVLSVEHAHDLVVAADGRPNPAGGNRTTVTVDGFAPGLLAEGEDPGPLTAHAFENYRFHAERLETSPGAAEQVPVLAHLGALTTGAAVTRTVPLERLRPGPPVNPFGAGSSSSFARTGRPTTSQPATGQPTTGQQSPSSQSSRERFSPRAPLATTDTTEMMTAANTAVHQKASTVTCIGR